MNVMGMRRVVKRVMTYLSCFTLAGILHLLHQLGREDSL